MEPGEEEAAHAGRAEPEADAFAAAFLIPLPSLLKDVAWFGACAGFLAARYGVSEATMRRRLRDARSADPAAVPGSERR
jgi:Zn-dependent peptidase ImmA (M78 family)